MTDEVDEAIRIRCGQLLADYAIAVDRGDADAVVALFAADGIIVRGTDAFRGHGEIPKILNGRPPGLVMRHLLTTQSITVAPSRERAEALTYYILYRGSGSDAPLSMPDPFSLGDWLSELVLTPDGWRVARLEIRRQFVRRDLR